MPNTVTLSNGTQTYSGTLILTDYGQSRLLERINERYSENDEGVVEGDGSFSPYNLNTIILGNKINNSYNSSITAMGEEGQVFTITDDNITVVGSTARINTELEISNNMTIQEIGVFELVNGSRRLFAYASGFSMI